MKTLQLFLLFFLITFHTFSQIEIKELLTENRVNPIGLDISEPRFTWKMLSEKRNVSQSAYQVRVAPTEADLQKGTNLIWDSGKIQSGQSVHVAYKGQPLKSGKRYYWQVKVWDQNNKASKWSPAGYWQTGFFNPEEEFSANWIIPGYKEDSTLRPSPYFRKEFNIQEKEIANATAFITAHGMYEARLNGQRIGNAYLTPGWTSYHNRLQYQTYDVTDMLSSADNAIGVVLGNGWYRGYLAWGDANNHYGKDIALLFQLEITYDDGTQETIVSNDTWQCSTGPILFSEIYDGEIYDSRKEMPGWSKAGFDNDAWVPAVQKEFAKDNLMATYNEPVRKQETFKPVDILTTPEGDLVVDFGQNLVGWVQLHVSGASGDTVKLYHAEVLDKEGNFYTTNLRAADQKNSYILNGKQNQTFEPHFTFQGFRYVKVEGFPGELKPENLTAIALYSDMRPTGEFSCSNELLNQLQHNIQWGQRGNFLDVPTDCPQRDERLGWTGDAQAFFRTAAYNRNVNNFFTKWMKDVAEDQLDNGAVPYVIPNVLGSSAAGSAGWADVATIIPWETYLLYGDKKMLEDQYPNMKKWVEYIRAQSTNDLWQSGFHFGDWLFYSPDDDRDGTAAITDKYLIAQCFYGYSTELLINAAKVLGKQEDVKIYADLLQKIKTAFQNEYMTPTGRLVSGTQTAYVLALHFDMLPEELRSKAAERLVANIASYDNHLTTGFLGTPYLNHVLSRFGKTETAYKLLLQESYPSWLYPVKMGATTVWERWNGIKPDGSFETPSMNSFNHYAYGAIGDWMYRNIAGINTSLEGPGYQKIIIKPAPGGELTRAEGSLETYYGKIKSRWEKEDGKFIQEVSVPVNTTADIFIPTESLDKVTENGKTISRAKDIKVIGSENGYVHLAVGSGNYAFTVLE